MKRRSKVKAVKGLNVGDKLRIKLPEYYAGFQNLTDYNPKEAIDLKKWCVEQALRVTILDEDGNIIQPNVIKIAQKIYDWVNK